MHTQCFVSCPIPGFGLHWLCNPGFLFPSVKEIQPSTAVYVHTLVTLPTVIILVFDILVGWDFILVEP